MRFYSLARAIVFCALCAAPSFAELTVTLTLPGYPASLDPLRDSFEAEIDRLLGSVTDSIEDTADKPRFVEGFSRAALGATQVSYAVDAPTLPYAYFGFSGAAYAEELDWRISHKVSGLTDDSDELMGASLRPFFASVRFPLERFVPRLSGGASIGFMDASVDRADVTYLSLGVSASYRLIPPRRGAVAWNGVSVLGSFDFARSSATARVDGSTQRDTIRVDEDGPGPLAPYDASVSITPSAEAEVSFTSLSLGAHCGTGVTFIDAITLRAGVGLAFGAAFVAADVAAGGEIVTTGRLQTLEQSPGRIDVSGSVLEDSVYSAEAYLEGGARFSMGSVSLSIPIVWRPGSAFGIGAFFGVEL